MKKTKVEIRLNSKYLDYNMYINDIHAGVVRGSNLNTTDKICMAQIIELLAILNKRKGSNNAMKLLAYKKLSTIDTDIRVVINHKVLTFSNFIKSAYGTTFGIVHNCTNIGRKGTYVNWIEW